MRAPQHLTELVRTHRPHLGVPLLLVALYGTSCTGSSEQEITERPSNQTTEGPESRNGLKLIAHRGVHHTFSSDGVDDQTCTASRIDPPAHNYIENTIRSMEAAFKAGATVVEIDIAPTSDGVLVVFHDWDLACRTNATGEIRSFTWDELSALDIGYGYTSDGETYPLRGLGVGLMPRMDEVFAAFPDGQFLINFKSNDPAEAALLQAVVDAGGATDQVWAVYGGEKPVEAYVAATGARGFTEQGIQACLRDYLIGTDGEELPSSCRSTAVIVPTDIAPVLPGWPERFIQTMSDHDTKVVVSGPGLQLTGIDTRSEFDLLPKDLDVYV